MKHDEKSLKHRQKFVPDDGTPIRCFIRHTAKLSPNNFLGQPITGYKSKRIQNFANLIWTSTEEKCWRLYRADATKQHELNLAEIQRKMFAY